jgi:hypothetical protein
MPPKKTKVNIEDCDFFLITVKGQMGSKKRHYSYDEAVKEATRLCVSENHEAFICGVVSSVKPIPQVEVVVR